MTPLNIIQPNCSNCGLATPNMRSRVPSKGPTGGLMIIGEAPGADEVAKKTPFIGVSGKLLRATLKAAGYNPDDVYYTNVCMCRPPDNRTPSDNEVKCCSGRLESEILAVQPTRILLLGSTPTQALLGKSILKCQGVYHEWNGIPVMPAFHPTFILRNPESFRDFAFAIDKLRKDPCNYYPLQPDGYPFIPYDLLLTESDSVRWLNYVSVAADGDVPERFTVDIEVGDRITGHKLLAVGMQFREEIMIIPGEVFLNSKATQQAFFNACSSKNTITTSQNGSYEYQQFWKMFGYTFPIDSDTMLSHYAIDERSGDDDTGGKGGSYHGLDTIAGLYLDAPNWKGLMAPYKEDYGLAPRDVLYRYLALDVSTEHRLGDVFEELEAEEDVKFLLKDLLLPAAHMLARVELNGVKLDLEYFAALEVQWRKDIEEEERKFRELVGKPNINIRSPKQISELLFDEWKLKKIDKRSTDKKVIEKLVRLYPDNQALALIAHIRSMNTILSTFIVGIPKLVDERDGLVHTRFLLHGTPTGRLASRNPNLQNIPARIGPVIRNGFIAEEGWELLNVDYKQLEFRVLGYYSNDRNLIQFIKDDRDIHSEVAAEFFNIPYGTETKPQRLDAKTFVFGIPYGRGPESIAEDFGLPLKEANRRYDVLRGMFPEAFVWIAGMQEQAVTKGYVMTATGRKRRWPLRTDRNIQEIKRQAANAPIQGLASDICLMAAMRVEQMLYRTGYHEHVKILILVHDSILFHVRKGYMEEVAPLIIAEMEKDPFPTPLPFNVDAERGLRWGDLEKIKIPA